MNIDAPAVQKEFAKIIGVSAAAVNNYVTKGILKKGDTYRVWLLIYCERQREVAGNYNSGGEKQTDLTQARINDLEARSKLNYLKYYREIKELVPLEYASNTLIEWAKHANQEYNGGIKRLIQQIESRNSCIIDRKVIEESTEDIMDRIIKFADDKIAQLGEDDH
ncbi:MAG: hypothetical protein KZQ83_12955 [gamma proteobacterium symbiont of Taylorina sp.]|nr:hypothetical protein [gamma proteobacterium symbiont of Taylorina sp.]